MPVITALEVHRRNGDSVKLFLDDDFAMDLTSLQAARLRAGQNLTEAEVQALSGAKAAQSAYDRALRFLSYRPRSVEEVRRYLERKAVAETTVAAVIGRLREREYVDDLAFARYWIESRNRFKPMAPRALRYELRQKGIEDAIIDSVLSEVDVEEAAYRAAQSRIARYRGDSWEDFEHKLSGMLRRRGFDGETIHVVTQRLRRELDETEDGYFERDADV